MTIFKFAVTITSEGRETTLREEYYRDKNVALGLFQSELEDMKNYGFSVIRNKYPLCCHLRCPDTGDRRCVYVKEITVI
ncbi:hypothetical protein KKH23_04290 [Patescibacteria group bacterium]|nr:hypothetical protein [Patescibacteria group bacterium]